MADTFIVRCQRVRQNAGGHFTMFFDREEGLPTVLMNVPKEIVPYEEGMRYRITIEAVAPGWLRE